MVPEIDQNKINYIFNKTRVNDSLLAQFITGHNNLFYHRSNIDHSSKKHADNDTGIQGETVELYECDANGNPATLVGTDTTDGSGAYAFGPDESGSAEVCLDPAETYLVEFATRPANSEFSTNDTCAGTEDADDVDPVTGLSDCYDPSDDDEGAKKGF